MEIIEALNIVSDYIDGKYQFEDDDGQLWIEAEALNAMQYLIDQGTVSYTHLTLPTKA